MMKATELPNDEKLRTLPRYVVTSYLAMTWADVWLTIKQKNKCKLKIIYVKNILLKTNRPQNDELKI